MNAFFIQIYCLLEDTPRLFLDICHEKILQKIAITYMQSLVQLCYWHNFLLHLNIKKLGYIRVYVLLDSTCFRKRKTNIFIIDNYKKTIEILYEEFHVHMFLNLTFGWGTIFEFHCVSICCSIDLKQRCKTNNIQLKHLKMLLFCKSVSMYHI